MDEAIKINSGAVSSLADSDLVLAATSGGTFQPISVSNFCKGIRQNIGIARLKNLDLTGGEWIRIARLSSSLASFCGILTLSHTWTSGKPCPLLCFVNGASKKEFNVEQLTKGSYYRPKEDNQGLSFTAVRMVEVNNTVYIEVRFKGNGAVTANVVCSLSGQINLELIDATISTASAANVLKEIDLSGGG